ncbi:MAG: hypothetical protein C0615_06285 [Desulfuromonas sp.]|nr:MAG: hypothetical protein C0615_06285 [Desulfuromonas sp.]
MLKNLKIYYLFVSLPYIMLMIGATIFWGPIEGTLDRNPHPQINYTIFVIIIGGGLIVLLNARRLMREAKVLVEFSKAVHAKTDIESLKELANSYTCDIACLLQMIASSSDRSISHQEQAALEHETENVHSRLNRRNALPSYLTGLLVGMGLLGTFIGLLATLGDIGALIGSFSDLDMSAADPIVVFSNMIEKMKAPMASMAIAFSASMFGLLGSIILGLMMVGIKRFQGDIFSVLSSEVARHIEVALSFESISFRGEGDAVGCYEQGSELTSKVLLRIEERLTEAARIRQRALSTEIDDFKKQRSDMLTALKEQTDANNAFRGEMQQLVTQLGNVFKVMEKGSGELTSQLSELTVQMAGNAKESHKLLATQAEEQKKLRDTIDSYNIEERLAESARSQQRMLTSMLEDFENQRNEMLSALNDQTETGNNLHNQLQQVGGQLGELSELLAKGNSEVSSQLSELTVQMATDAKQAQSLISTASGNVRGELQQLGTKFAENITTLTTTVEKGDGEICDQVAELAKDSAETSRQAQVQQADFMGRLVEQIEKGDGELASRIAGLQKDVTDESNQSGTQRAEMLKNLAEQVEANSKARAELQKISVQLGTIAGLIEKGNGTLVSKVSELAASMSEENQE